MTIASNILETVRAVIGPTNGVIPLHEPEFKGNERAYVIDCVETGWVSSVGAYVDRLERDLAKVTGVDHAVATSNGTSALHICFILAGVKPGDEVLMPSLTFIATANAAVYAGGVPHFVDVETTSLGIDPVKLEAHLQTVARIEGDKCVNRVTGATIRALCVMHVFGHPCQLDELLAVANRWKLVLVEDAAESLGALYHGHPTGRHGLVSALSFNGNKVVTTGGGGAVLTNDPELGRRAKHLTTTARVSDRWNFIHDEVGYNYRMPNINAALGCAQIERLDDFIDRKRRLAARYQQAFASVPGTRFLSEPEGTASNYWLNAIVLDRANADELVEVLTALNDAGYSARPIWTLMSHLPMFQSNPRADLTVSEQMATSVVNLPSSPGLAGA